MAPTAPLFSYEPSANVIKAVNSPADIVVRSNNVCLSAAIPARLKDSGYEDFMTYLISCPLRYALSDHPTHFYLRHVCEFYYTSTFYPMSRTIIASTNDGQTTISVTVDDVRHALRLPIRQNYDDLPDADAIRSALSAIRYDIS